MAVTAIIVVMPRNREPLSRIHISVDFNADKTAIVNPVEYLYTGVSDILLSILFIVYTSFIKSKRELSTIWLMTLASFLA